MSRRIFASFSAATVIAAAALTGVTASSAAADTTSNPVIAAGQLVDATGADVAGADIELLMWPTNDVLSQQAEGDSVNLVPVASALSDSSGNFTLSLPDVNALLAGAGTDGLANFTLLATTPDGQIAHYAFSREILQETVNGVLSTVVASPTDIVDGTITNLINSTVNNLLGALGLSPINLVLPVNNILLTLGQAGQSTAAVPDGSVVDQPDDAGTVLQDKNCTSTLVTKYAPKNAVVGQQGSYSAGVTSDFTYTRGQSTTFGVAFSASGKYGSFNASGTSSSSSSMTEIYASQHGAGFWHHRSEWIPAKYHVQCFTPYGSGGDGYETRTYGYAGGATTVSLGTSALPAVSQSNCVGYGPNTGSQNIYSAAVTYSGGFEVGDVVGINLSAQTGYSTGAQTSYHWGSAGGFLCGTAGLPGQTPRMLIAK